MDRLAKFHDRVEREGTVYYPPKKGMERSAKLVIQWTGVCPACHRRAITVGRCVQCGWEMEKAK